MTESEYYKKREAYASRSAPMEVIDKAIKELDQKYLASQSRTNLVLKDIQEGAADIDDIPS